MKIERPTRKPTVVEVKRKKLKDIVNVSRRREQDPAKRKRISEQLQEICDNMPPIEE